MVDMVGTAVFCGIISREPDSPKEHANVHPLCYHTMATPYEIDAMHEKAHANCFIANSVRTEVIVLP